MSAAPAPVVLVTGALGDIGRATAVLLAQAGMSVVATDLAEPTPEGSGALLLELESAGARASYVAADQAEEGEVRAVLDFVLDTHGRLDGAANIAAVPQARTPLVEMASADFARITQVNVVGVFHWVKHELLAMREGASIVNMSSAQGVMGVANQVAYTTSRHAVCGLTRAAAVEAGERGIRVNAVLPGSVRTSMQEAVHGALDSPENLARARGLHLLGRIAEVDEVGRTVRWLLSEESSFITGALVPVDGGLTSGRRV